MMDPPFVTVENSIKYAYVAGPKNTEKKAGTHCCLLAPDNVWSNHLLVCLPYAVHVKSVRQILEMYDMLITGLCVAHVYSRLHSLIILWPATTEFTTILNP